VIGDKWNKTEVAKRQALHCFWLMEHGGGSSLDPWVRNEIFELVDAIISAAREGAAPQQVVPSQESPPLELGPYATLKIYLDAAAETIMGMHVNHRPSWVIYFLEALKSEEYDLYRDMLAAVRDDINEFLERGEW
jgi:hypothetical protein